MLTPPETYYGMILDCDVTMLMMEMMIMVFFYDNEKTKTHPNDMTLKSKYTNSSDYYLVKRGLTSRQNISTSDFMNLA